MTQEGSDIVKKCCIVAALPLDEHRSIVWLELSCFEKQFLGPGVLIRDHGWVMACRLFMNLPLSRQPDSNDRRRLTITGWILGEFKTEWHPSRG